MRKSRFNFLAVIGMVVAFGTFAFTAPKENKNAAALHWFEVEEGIVTDYIGTMLTGECSESKVDVLCAQAYTEEQTIPNGSERILAPTTNPNDFQSQGFRDEN